MLMNSLDSLEPVLELFPTNEGMKYTIFKPYGSDRFVAAKSVEMKASDKPVVKFPSDMTITFTADNVNINEELFKQLTGY